MKNISAIGISVFLAISFCMAFPEDVELNNTENATALENTTNATLLYIGDINATALQNVTTDDLLATVLKMLQNTSDTSNNSRSIPVYYVQSP